MKIASWNINGLRAIIRKGDFQKYMEEISPDIIGLQEIKLQEGQVEVDLPDYYEYWNYAERPGYSGTAVFTKTEPLNVTYGLGVEEHDTEGRVITLEFEEFYFITCYTPNSQRELARLDYRMEWDDCFRQYVSKLDEKKPVIISGDLNVAHEEIDLKNPSTNRRNAGFTDEERAKFTELLEAGFVDTFRHFYPDVEGAYTWWSYITRARDRNAGWRIDYLLVSNRFIDKVKSAEIHSDAFGSDHCPVFIELDI